MKPNEIRERRQAAAHAFDQAVIAADRLFVSGEVKEYLECVDKATAEYKRVLDDLAKETTDGN